MYGQTLGGSSSDSLPDDLRLRWQHHLETILWTLRTIVEQDVLGPGTDVNRENPQARFFISGPMLLMVSVVVVVHGISA